VEPWSPPAPAGGALVALGAPRSAGVLSPAGWALAAGITGPTTVAALAETAGGAPADTLAEIEALLRAGFLTAVAEGRDRPGAPDGPDSTALPRRRPGSSAGRELDLSGIPARDPEGRPFETPDEQTLSRLLGLLRAW
jgi:hypothetical protein